MYINYRYDEFYDELKDFNIGSIIRITEKILSYFPELTNTNVLMYFDSLHDKT